MKNNNVWIRRVFCISCIFLISLFSNLTGEDQLNWVMKKAGNAFSFLAPMELADQKVQGIDSLVGLYKSDKVYLYFDYGNHSDALKGAEKKAEFIEKAVTIDGRGAKLVSHKYEDSKEYTYFTGIFFENVVIKNSDKSRASPKLTMTALCKNKSDLKSAEEIFLSIKFDSISARVKKLIGEKNLELIENPDKVTLQRIETSFKTDAVSEKILNAMVLNKEQFNKFKLILTDDNAYWWEIVSNCEPVPGLALVCEKGYKKFTVRFCLECGIIIFDPHGGLKQFNPSVDSLLDLFVESFPKDEVLLKLKKF